MRRKWIQPLRIYLGSTDCDLDEKDYRLDRRSDVFDSRENGSDCGPHLLFVEIDPLCVKESLLHDKATLLCLKEGFLRAKAALLRVKASLIGISVP
jgi:hypothetical protein